MKTLGCLVLATLAAQSQQPQIGVCAAPTPFLGGYVLTASLVGDVKALAPGTIVRLMHGQTVTSEVVITELVNGTPKPIEPPTPSPDAGMPRAVAAGLLLRGIAQEGDTVSIAPPTGEAYSIAISPIIIGTVQVENKLAIFLMSSSPSAGVFIDGQSLPVGDVNISLGGQGFINVDVGNFRGWHMVTACQPGACDTALVRFP